MVLDSKEMVLHPDVMMDMVQPNRVVVMVADMVVDHTWWSTTPRRLEAKNTRLVEQLLWCRLGGLEKTNGRFVYLSL